MSVLHRVAVYVQFPSFERGAGASSCGQTVDGKQIALLHSDLDVCRSLCGAKADLMHFDDALMTPQMVPGSFSTLVYQQFVK